MYLVSISDLDRVDYWKYSELHDEPMDVMTDVIDENLNVLVLLNLMLKYLKSIRIGQTINSIVTRNIWLMIQLTFWPLASNIDPWYGLP